MTAPTQLAAARLELAQHLITAVPGDTHIALSLGAAATIADQLAPTQGVAVDAVEVDHHAEAERLIGEARGEFGDRHVDTPAVSHRLTEAQVHATLALEVTIRKATTR